MQPRSLVLVVLIAGSVLSPSARALDAGYSTFPKFSVDVNRDGYADYCRFVGSSASPMFSCALLGANGVLISDYGYNSQGYGDPGLSDLPREMVDINADGRVDYCRFVGSRAAPQLSCMLGGATGWGANYGFSSVGAVDPGFAGYRVFFDSNGDGRKDYCRLVGSGKTKFFSCLQTTATGFNSNQYTQTVDCPCWTLSSFETWFGTAPTCSPYNYDGTVGTGIVGSTVPGPCEFDASKTCYFSSGQGWSVTDSVGANSCMTRDGRGNQIDSATRKPLTPVQHLACSGMAKARCGQI